MSPSEMRIAGKVRGLLVVIAAVASALVLAAPASAERNLTASARTVRPGQVINIGGTGWDTFWAVLCAGTPIYVDFTQPGVRLVGDSLLTIVSELEVWPFTGGWNHDVRIPLRAHPGPATIRVFQDENYYDLLRGCQHRHPGPYYEDLPYRTLDVTVVGPAVAEPAPPAPEIELEGVLPSAGLNRARPAATLTVSGTGFNLPDRCRFNDARFSLTDASGTGRLLGAAFRVDQRGRLTDQLGRPMIHLSLPDQGLTPGPAALSAEARGYGVGCTRTAGVRLTIVAGPLTVRAGTSNVAAGQVVRVTGTNWRTDRCDRAVRLFFLQGGDRAELATVGAGKLGSFTIAAKVPEQTKPGLARIAAEQLSGLEYRSKATPPGKTRCYFAKLTKRVASFALTVQSPPSTPSPPAPSPPPPPPPPSPAPTQCANGKDDDGDGKVDLADPGCTDAKDDSESPDPVLPQCANGKDDDGDGLVDLADPGCENAKDDSESPDPKVPECSDGKDNDGDGEIDYPNDKQCSSKEDNDEAK